MGPTLGLFFISKIFIDMKKKLIINESQLKMLKQNILENDIHGGVVKQMKEFLDKNYEPMEKFVREGGEYFEKPMVMVRADEEVISPKALYEYMKYKFNMGEEFTKQVIRDWISNKITDDYKLSKNVALK